jgi:hypothetical protein
MPTPTTIADVAEAVKDRLNDAPDGTFSLDFTASRVYEPEGDLSAGGFDKLTVAVAPQPNGRKLASRGEASRTIRVVVVIKQKLESGVDPTSPAANEWIDARLLLSQQIVEYLSIAHAAAGAQWMATLQDATYSHEMLKTPGIFFSGATLDYMLVSD